MKWIKSEQGEYYYQVYGKDFLRILKQAIMSADWSRLPTKSPDGDPIPKFNPAELAKDLIFLIEDMTDY